VVHYQTGLETEIKIPGEWTYDPAGVTDDTHRPEVLDEDTFTLLVGVTVA
jgi:hypothetical protein